MPRLHWLSSLTLGLLLLAGTRAEAQESPTHPLLSPSDAGVAEQLAAAPAAEAPAEATLVTLEANPCGPNGCGHVIEMLMRTSLLKQADLRWRAHRDALPGGQILPDPRGWLRRDLGDLELIGVQLIGEGDPENGPLYQVAFRNASCRAVENFRISVVAVLGRIDFDAPTVTLRIPRLEAGETAAIQVQMPALALTMGPAGGEAIGFDTLVVALDSFDEFVESDELNNVAVLKRAEVQVLVSESPATGPAAPSTPAPENAPPAVVPPTPAPPANPSPLDQIDLDNLDLDQQQGTSLFRQARPSR